MIRRERDEETAELLGLSGPAFSQWRDRPNAPADTAKVEALAKLSGMDFDWLLRGERSPSAPPPQFATFLVVYRDWVKRGGLKRVGKEKKSAPGIIRERTTTLKVEEKGKKRSSA